MLRGSLDGLRVFVYSLRNVRGSGTRNIVGRRVSGEVLRDAGHHVCVPRGTPDGIEHNEQQRRQCEHNNAAAEVSKGTECIRQPLSWLGAWWAV